MLDCTFNELREKALSMMALGNARQDMGIYCKKVTQADGTVTERGQFGEGWTHE